MKQKLLTIISSLLVLLPWLSLLLKKWSKLPGTLAVDITILVCAVLLILIGIFTILAYCKGRVQNAVMKICLIINSIYALCGVTTIGMMLLPNTI